MSASAMQGGHNYPRGSLAEEVEEEIQGETGCTRLTWKNAVEVVARWEVASPMKNLLQYSSDGHCGFLLQVYALSHSNFYHRHMTYMESIIPYSTLLTVLCDFVFM